MLRNIVVVITLLFGASAAAGQTKRPNLLFIAVDDLRPQMKCYGESQMITPNMDRLAERGMLFERAYCQQAVCAPSRASLLTGCRPSTTEVTDLETPLPTVRPDLVTLPKHFRDHGYATVSLGKIYHHGAKDDPQGFSEEVWSPGGGQYVTEEGKRIEAEAAAGNHKLVRGLPYEAGEVEDEAYRDGKVAVKAIEYLKQLKDEPFFLAVGFYKPHLPFVAPKKYWDLYDPASIELPEQPTPPADAPDIAFTSFGELRRYHGMPKEGPLSEAQTRQLIHGYYAATSYTDTQVGKLLDALEELGLAENTIVILWGDHGWHLGDLGQWCKHTNFEIATRSPLLIAGPGIKPSTRTRGLTEFVDIYPSLCELAGLPLPAQLQGQSFVPLLEQPDMPWKRAAFSQYPHQGRMGYSVRTDRWRFTRWPAKKGAPVEYELYDHSDGYVERENVAGRAEHAKLIEELNALLDEYIASSASPSNESKKGT